MITFENHTLIKHTLRMKIGGRTYLLKNQIREVEATLRRIDSNWALQQQQYLEARGVMIVKVTVTDEYSPDEYSPDYCTYREVECSVTSRAEVERCLEELRDIEKRFQRDNEKIISVCS